LAEAFHDASTESVPGAWRTRSPRLSQELEEALLSPEYLADPYPIYAQMPRDPSLAWSEAFRSWIVTSYEDVVWATREPKLIVHERMPTLLSQLPAEERARAQPIVDHYARTLAFTDPPRHKEVRALLQTKFSAAAVEPLRPRVRELVDSFLDTAGPEEFDVTTQLAFPLPVDVIGEILGVPRQDRAQFRPWTDRIMGLFQTGRAETESVAAGLESLGDMRSYLKGVIDDRTRRPQDDLISWLVANSGPGQVLTEDEVIANCVMFYTAGHATTSALIANAFLALFRNPDELQKLRDDPTLIRHAVEELIRYATSVQRAWRVAGEDVEYRGCVIRKGDPVYPLVGAANHDRDRFEHPETLDVERANVRHLAFGLGIHFCLGADLARLETAVAIEAFLARFPRAEFFEERLVWGGQRAGSSLGTLLSLPVRIR
jgi:cytochrome P450